VWLLVTFGGGYTEKNKYSYCLRDCNDHIEEITFELLLLKNNDGIRKFFPGFNGTLSLQYHELKVAPHVTASKHWMVCLLDVIPLLFNL